jgi:Transposase DDE domain
MDTNTFLIQVYCLIDDFMKNQRIRTRGPQPVLSDSEVLTMEIIGSFLGIDTDKGLYTYFRRHYGEWFPALLTIHRTTFTRQMANLWKVKEMIWHHVLNDFYFDSQISVIDSFPVPICRFARAYRCRCLRDVAAYGRDEIARQTFLGLRAHLRICWPGVIVDFRLAPANISELEVAEEMFTHVKGWALGDRNYWSPKLSEELLAQGLSLLTPFKKASRETRPWPIWMKHMRYRIETVIGQLVERFHAKRTWARDAWHLYSRWLRKILCHTFATFFCQNNNLSMLRFAELISD